MLVLQLIFLINTLYFLSPNKFGNFWSYPAYRTYLTVQENREKYDAIFISDRIDNVEFAYPVYARIDPKKVIEQNKKKTVVGEFQFKRFDNVYIGSIPKVKVKDFINSQEGKILYIGLADEKQEFKLYETLQGSDNLDSLVLFRKQVNN